MWIFIRILQVEVQRILSLVAGWKSTPMGEVWLVQSLPMTLYGSGRGRAYERHHPTISPSQEHSQIQIPFGHYNIENHCIVPKNNGMDSVAWQNGPYFDLDLSVFPPWRTSNQMTGMMTSSKLLELVTCLDSSGQGEGHDIDNDDECNGSGNNRAGHSLGLVEACNSRRKFVIRDRIKVAHSRTARLTDVRREGDNWRVHISFVD
uniref:Uncharacterized protein n=1 Tax=Chaetoceros debilis TaxID=122233 RepID=A0A7S3V9J5_9STRA